MATYQDIKGLRVKYLSADPSTLVGGDVWYNSTSGTLKGVVNLAAWSSASPMNTARRGLAGIGTQAASLGASGYIGPTVSYPNVTEEYNGSGWTNSNNVGTARDMMAACGTQTAGLIAGGRNATTANGLSEEYNGSSWTEGSNLNTDRGGLLQNGAGTQTAGLAVGGFTGPSGTKTGATEEYNGASWTTSPGSLSTARSAGALFGIQTAAVAATGEAPPNSPAVEEYDGSTWTAGTVVPTPAATQECSSFGTATDGLMVGGTEEESLTLGYDGTTWTALPSLATGRYAAGAAGTTPAGILFAGAGTPPLQTNTTEEYNSSTSSFTAAAWSSIPSLNTARGHSGGVGIQTAALIACGDQPSVLPAATEEYDGSSWTSLTDGPQGRSKPFAAGITTAAVVGGGESGPDSGTTSIEWNGSVWGSPAPLPMTMFNSCAFGTEAAAVAVNSPSPTTGVILYDGSTWTVGTSIPTQFKSGAASGVDTAGIVFGNDVGPFSTDTFEYASGTWTSGGALNSGRARGSSSKNAPQTSTLYFGGNNPGGTEKNETESYDGTTWSTSPTIATAVRGNTGGGASSSSAVNAGGYNGSSYITSAEEFTGETSAVTASTLTTS